MADTDYLGRLVALSDHYAPSRAEIHAYGGCPEGGGTTGCGPRGCHCEFAAEGVITRDTLYGRHIREVVYDMRRRGWVVIIGGVEGGLPEETCFLGSEQVYSDPDLLRMVERHAVRGLSSVRTGHAIYRPEQVGTLSAAKRSDAEVADRGGPNSAWLLYSMATVFMAVAFTFPHVLLGLALPAGLLYAWATVEIKPWRWNWSGFFEDLVGPLEVTSLLENLDGPDSYETPSRPFRNTHVVRHYGFTPGKGTRMRSRP